MKGNPTHYYRYICCIGMMEVSILSTHYLYRFAENGVDNET